MANGSTDTTTNQAAKAMRYYAVWQRKFADGETDKQYTDWIEEYLQSERDSEDGDSSPASILKQRRT